MAGFGDRLTAQFGGSERYWKTRRAARRTYFATAGRIFRARYAISEGRANASALRYLLGNAVMPVLLACGLIAVFAALQGVADDLAGGLHLGPLNEDAYNSMLEAVASVTGVFLALYFTAVSGVVAAVYASVPHDVRQLMLRDRLGNVYTAGVAFTMALSVLLLAVHAASGSAYRLALPIVGSLSLFSIFAFIRLGQRAFSLYDPTRLADTLLRDFAIWFRGARYGGWRWDVDAFQDHYRRQARRAVETLASLVAIANNQEHLRGASSHQLVTRVSTLLGAYVGALHEVPTQSRWFGQRYEHSQVYLASTTELQMADMGGSFSPKTVPDSSWVEDLLLGPLVEGVLVDIRAKDIETAVSAMGSFPDLWGQIGEAWRVPTGLRWAKQLSDGIVEAVASLELKIEARFLLVPGLLEVTAMLPTSVELGLHRAIDDLDIPSLGRRIRESNWSDDGTPYRFSLPSSVVRAMEETQSGVAFECAVRAPDLTRTPGWYIEEYALFALEKDLMAQIDETLDLLRNWYPAAVDRLVGANQYDAAAAVLSRAVEVVAKLERHLPSWQAKVDAIRAEGERVDFNRPTWDWTAHKATVSQLRSAVLERSAQLIAPLALHDRRDDLPDFFGEVVHRTGQACFDALTANDTEAFKTLFPHYFIGTFMASQRIKGDVADLFLQQAITWMFEPIVDCLELSGYAYIYAELHGDPQLWETCRAAWKKYLADEGEDALKRIAALSAFEQSQFSMTPRSLIRTHWQQALTGALEELPREDAEPSEYPFEHRPVRHRSPLIRRIAPDKGPLGARLLQNARDVFIEKFLARQAGAAGLDFGVADWVARELVDEDPADEKGGTDG